MTVDPDAASTVKRGIWWLAFGVLALYVAARMGAFALWANVATQAGSIRLPNTFASVDHPFHAARAEILWRELASGQLLRWVGQHQGGYPVEFYPLGEAWFEVAVRALSLGSLSAEGAHTLSVIALFLLPGVAYATLARVDGWSPAVGFIAVALHIALPGSWYHGGYTELVQWGLVTNVAGAAAAFMMLPAMIRYLTHGEGWAGATAAALAAWAVYCNPRSLLGLAALACGAWLAVAMARRAPTSISPTDTHRGLRLRTATLRLAQVVTLAALLAAPELIALARFGDFYTFVRYSGYDGIGAYAGAAVGAVTWPVVTLGLVGLLLGLTLRQRLATTAVAASLVLYIVLTVTVAFVPVASRLAPQLEPTRLMPLQRLLTIYLAAVAVSAILDWLLSRMGPRRVWISPVAAVAFAVAILVIQTRSLDGPPPDPASSAVPPVSLYPVSMSARPEQFDLQLAIRTAEEAARSGTGILVLGSALSWHQQLWSPLWTTRPLFYDNWLWYWHPNHGGTPAYSFLAGHHYPDAERTLDPVYLARHGIGAVVVTGPIRAAAASSPLLQPLRDGIFNVYAVLDPVTTVSFGDENAALLAYGNQQIAAIAEMPGAPVIVRANWHPRWNGHVDSLPDQITHQADGYLVLAADEPARTAEFNYIVQPADWAARLLAAVGLMGLGWLIVRSNRPDPIDSGWYSRRSTAAAHSRGGGNHSAQEEGKMVSEHTGA